MLATPTGHTVRSEGDLILVQFQGALTLADAEVLSAAYSQEIERRGYLLLLVDLAGADNASTEARRKLVLWAEPHSHRISAACYGGSLLVRSFMQLMNGAVRLLSGKPSGLAFFGTEAEARQFLLRERSRLLQQVTG